MQGMNTRMRKLLTPCFLLVALAATAAHAESLVVAKKFSAMACCSIQGHGDRDVARRHVVLDFTTSQVVDVLAKDGRRQLIRSFGGGDLSAWTERDSRLVGTGVFAPMAAWKGQSVFRIYTADYDSGMEYRFARDGSFKASEDESGGSHSTWSGHLYRYRQIVWARPAGRKAHFDPWNVFQLRSDGTICILDFDQPGGVQCVDSMN